MITPDKIIQLKAYARQDGALTALLWVASFAFVVYLPASSLGNLLALSTPFFVGWRLCRFRNEALGGLVSLRRGYAYSVYTFFYASLLFALAQFLYFRFMDDGRFASLINDTLQTLMPIYEQNGFSREEINDSMGMMTQLSPIYWAMLFMMQNMLIGLIVSLPIAAICTRKARTMNI